MRVELTATTTNMQLHLGSSNCSDDQSIEYVKPGTVSCVNSYRPTRGFNPDTDTITIDADELF